MLTLHLEHEGRNARVSLTTPPAANPQPPLEQVTPAGRIHRVQVLNGQIPISSGGLEGAALVAGDPEIDLRSAGRLIRDATAVYLDSSAGETAIAADFKEIEIAYGVDGQEKERRNRVFRTANLDGATPLKIARRLPAKDVLTRFVFRGVQQLIHTDGLTFDFLHGLARSLQQTGSMGLLGSGPKGAAPLVLRDGGSPFRGFLFGETEGDGDAARYRLLLLLSDQELKRPASPAPIS